jgi:hypothetical protein
MERLTSHDQAAVTATLHMLIQAAGDEYGITEYSPVPL